MIIAAWWEGRGGAKKPLTDWLVYRPDKPFIHEREIYQKWWITHIFCQPSDLIFPGSAWPNFNIFSYTFRFPFSRVYSKDVISFLPLFLVSHQGPQIASWGPVGKLPTKLLFYPSFFFSSSFSFSFPSPNYVARKPLSTPTEWEGTRKRNQRKTKLVTWLILSFPSTPIPPPRIHSGSTTSHIISFTRSTTLSIMGPKFWVALSFA